MRRFGWRQRRIVEAEIDALLWAGVALDFHAYGGRRHVEHGASDADRQALGSPGRAGVPRRAEQGGDQGHCSRSQHAANSDRQGMAMSVRRAGTAGRKHRHGGQGISEPNHADYATSIRFSAESYRLACPPDAATIKGFLRIMWRTQPVFAKPASVSSASQVVRAMSVEAFNSLFSLLIG